ncbi:MAG: cyclic pyranopterin monophosphate synthase MoaC [Planctomycetota bacterium]|nr:cyclic pyranopterin monophosphate synthase MoaC [Planctomycetota bacterium]MDA1114741.1 cyclic pyranopterin monophosphate synthase MoaC [Planctomycetota bacterium]
MSDSPPLSHLEEDGGSRMVNVGAKPITFRTAEAEAIVRYPVEAFHKVLAGEIPKGGIVEPARVAGILAAKRTAELIPMCHGLSLDWVQIIIEPLPNHEPGLSVRCTASLEGRTGVEMEAMMGATMAALTLYDMTKALDKRIQIEKVRLLKKTGGKSGTWKAQ